MGKTAAQGSRVYASVEVVQISISGEGAVNTNRLKCRSTNKHTNSAEVSVLTSCVTVTYQGQKMSHTPK